MLYISSTISLYISVYPSVLIYKIDIIVPTSEACHRDWLDQVQKVPFSFLSFFFFKFGINFNVLKNKNELSFWGKHHFVLNTQALWIPIALWIVAATIYVTYFPLDETPVPWGLVPWIQNIEVSESRSKFCLCSLVLNWSLGPLLLFVDLLM